MKTKIVLIIATLLVAAILLAFSGCENGPAYQGDLQDGQPHGNGTLTYDYGTVYRGTFNHGLRDGSGIWTHPSGISYSGSWKNDIYHNWGTLTIPNYISYEGFWNEGRKEGQGVQKWPDGRHYDGHWQNGRMHGFGVMYYPDGSVYSGEWCAGRCEGLGELTTPEGETLVGRWEKGEFVYVPVIAIALDPQELNLTEGEQSSQLQLTILPLDATNKAVEWNTGDPTIATVDQEGFVTPLTPGTTEITALTLGEELEAICSVRVRPVWVSVQSVRIHPPYLSLYIYDSPGSLHVEVLPLNATNKTVIWSSANPEIASVNPYSGLVTPKAMGSTTITAKTEDGGFTATCHVQVRLMDVPVFDNDTSESEETSSTPAPTPTEGQQ